MSRRYTLIWKDSHGEHRVDYIDLDTLINEIHQCLEIDTKRKEMCDYRVEVEEV